MRWVHHEYTNSPKVTATSKVVIWNFLGAIALDHREDVKNV